MADKEILDYSKARRGPRSIRGLWPLLFALASAVVFTGVYYFWWIRWSSVQNLERIFSFPFIVLGSLLAMVSLVGGVCVWRRKTDIDLLPHALVVLVLVFLEVLFLLARFEPRYPNRF